MLFRKKFRFYLPKLNKEMMFYANDESTAVWKLFNLFKLRESEVDDYIIINSKK